MLCDFADLYREADVTHVEYFERDPVNPVQAYQCDQKPPCMFGRKEGGIASIDVSEIGEAATDVFNPST